MAPNGRKRQKSEQKVIKETIHSGHFMVSDIDDSEAHDDDEGPSLAVHESDCDQENSPIPVRGYDFEKACKETSKTYTFGPRSSHCISIDASLTKLFECMTLAYSGKLTSPRWKQFKGLKLRLKEKIRLNNIIWRAWHMQFVLRMKPFVCQFASPLDGDTHSKPEAVVIEGTYWKRKMTNITAEYQKWRLFYKDRLRQQSNFEADSMSMDMDMRWPSWSKDNFFCLSGSMDEDFIMDFSDTLFSTFNPSQPFDFPNPREIAAKAGIADFIQPGLVQLQPSVDDFMDTFEPLQDFLNSRLPPLLEESADALSVSEQQVNSFGMPTSINPFNTSNILTPRALSGSKENSFCMRKPRQFTRPHETRLVASPVSDKMMTNNLLSSSSNDSLSQISVRPLVQNQDSSLQPSFQTLVHNEDVQVPCVPPSDGLSIASLLQSTIQDSTRINRINSEEHLDSHTLHHTTPQHNKRERTSMCFQQSSLPTENSHQSVVNIAPKDNTFVQPVQSIQVPLTSLSTHLTSGIPVSSSSSMEAKGQKYPLFLFDLGQSPQLPNQTSNVGSFNIPVQVSGIAPSQFPLITQNQINIVPSQSFSRVKHEQAKGEAINNRMISVKSPSIIETQSFRRHSYATGQYIQTTIGLQSVDNSNNNCRRSRLIAPATTSSNCVGSFIIPDVPAKQRTRSRSVSSPQCGSPKSFAQQSCQAVSLNDISNTPPVQPVFTAQNVGGKSITLVTESPRLTQSPVNSSTTSANILSSNALLAQLLSSGHTQNDASQSITKESNSSLPVSTSPLTILRSIPTMVTTAAQAFVFSPIPIATVSGVSDFQRSILVGAANQVFGSQSGSSSVTLSPSPRSSGLTCCPSPLSASMAYDGNLTSKPLRPKSDEERIQYKEHRRVCHINAEQKRRCNIKNGFEALHHLLPPMSQNPNMKVSKAAMLQKAAEHIRTLKSERQQQQEEAELLKQQIESLNQAISRYQNQLPASGAPVPCQRTNRMKEMFEEYVRQQTLQNWKFWIFSLILEPLMESYNSNVSTANVDEMYKTILVWLDQHCSLVSLRPGVLNSLRHLSTTTNILSDPSRMPEEATRAVTKKESRQ